MDTKPLSPIILEAEQLSFTYENQEVPVFSHVSFVLRQGEMLCLAGPNGSGKSSLLCLLAGVYQGRQGGIVRMWDTPPVPDAAGIPLKQEHIRLVLQDADMQLIGNTVGEDVLLGVRYASASEEDRAVKLEQARTLTRRFHLENHWDTPPQYLSYGQKRKVCIVAALMHEPRLLLLDEPFSGLDYPACLELSAMLAELLADGLPLIVSTHDLVDVASMIRHVLLLGIGQPPRFGTLAALAPLFPSYGVRPVACSTY